MNDALIILQARIASARLPGKALAPIGARTLLAHCLVRLRIGRAAPVMLATTTGDEDDVLAAAASRHGAAVFRGPDRDVLLRFALAARAAGARYVVRATADNPAIDIDGPRRVLDLLRSSGADHVVEDGLPYGAAVEAMTVDALNRAVLRASEPADREHVTTLIRRDRTLFNPLVTPAPTSLRRPEVRLTVDTDRDLWFMRHIAARLGNWIGEPELDEIIEAVDAFAVETEVA